MPKEREKLLPRQQAFVEAYAAAPNPRAAAIKAGYSLKGATSQAAFLLAHPGVIEALQVRKGEALARLEVTEDMVLRELAVVAFSNLEDFVTWDDEAGALKVKPSAEIPRQIMAALADISEKSIKTTNKDGSRSYTIVNRHVKLYPKLEALKLLAEYLGLTDSMAPKVTVHLVTGIKREPDVIDVTPEPE